MRGSLLFVSLMLATWAATPALAEGVPCGTCHDPLKGQARHEQQLKGHAGLACVDCHRGDPSAQAAEAAHPKTGPDQLLGKGRTGAACVRCHVAGSVPGTEVVIAGGRIYLEQGCYLCHLGQNRLGNLAAFGPPLPTIGGRGTPYLQGILHNPKATFKDTAMPSFEMALQHRPGSEEQLLTFLLSLREDLGKPTRPELSKKRCATCHAGAKPDATALPKHRCVWIREDDRRVSCQGCHPKGVPSSARECLYLEQRRQECGVCHEGAVDEG